MQVKPLKCHKRNVFTRKKRYSILIAIFLCLLCTFGVFNTPLDLKQALPEVNNTNLYFSINISIKEEEDIYLEFYSDFDYKSKIQPIDGITSLEDIELYLFLVGSIVIGGFVLVEFGVIVGKQSEKWKKKINENYGSNTLNIIDRESLIFESVQQYMEKNRCFEENKILPVLKSICSKTGFNISEHGIKLVLKNLVSSKCFVEGSRITKREVLNNQNRADIYGYIKMNPGIHFTNITKHLNLHNYLTRWHLDVLLKFEYIWNENIGNIEAFFDSDIPKEDGKIIHLLSREKVRLILDFLRNDNNDNITRYKVSKALKMHLNTVNKYISLLEDYKILHINSRKNTIVLNADFSKY